MEPEILWPPILDQLLIFELVFSHVKQPTIPCLEEEHHDDLKKSDVMLIPQTAGYAGSKLCTTLACVRGNAMLQNSK